MIALSKHSDIQRQRLDRDRDRNGDRNRDRNRNQTETFTQTTIFVSDGVPSSSARGLGGKKGRKPSRAALYDLSKDCRSYEWREPLYPLRDWLRKHGIDVGALKSERQALWLAKRLGRQGKKMPHRLAPLFPALLKIQRTLCPTMAKAQNAAFHLPVSGRSELGTFGPASGVRSVSIAAYLAERAAAQNGGHHG